MVKKEIKVIADAMLEKKAEVVISLDLRDVGTAISDFFIVCDAQSGPQVRAIADNVEEKMAEKMKLKPLHKQGVENGFWVILDYGSSVVHIFKKEYREFYRLEDLWADAKKTVFKESVTAAVPAEK